MWRSLSGFICSARTRFARQPQQLVVQPTAPDVVLYGVKGDQNKARAHPILKKYKYIPVFLVSMFGPDDYYKYVPPPVIVADALRFLLALI